MHSVSLKTRYIWSALTLVPIHVLYPCRFGHNSSTGSRVIMHTGNYHAESDIENLWSKTFYGLKERVKATKILSASLIVFNNISIQVWSNSAFCFKRFSKYCHADADTNRIRTEINMSPLCIWCGDIHLLKNLPTSLWHVYENSTWLLSNINQLGNTTQL